MCVWVGGWVHVLTLLAACIFCYQLVIVFVCLDWQGLVTAPVLFASYTHPHVLDLMARRFEAPGDVLSACNAVNTSKGCDQTRQLAYAHAQKALDALLVLPDSLYRDSLAALALRVIHRTS